MEFIPIKGYESRYAINKLGQVKSLKSGIILKHYTNGVGYSRVGFYDKSKGRSKEFYVHRLLAIHFIPNPENKKFINHKDGNPQNNSLENLEWCTKSENGLHAYKIGLNHNNTKLGEDHPSSKLNNQIVLDIRNRFKNGERQIDIARSYNLNRTAIYQIVRNKSWRHLITN